MKLTLKLTLDGLMRVLRAQAHRRAEEIEAGRLLPRAAVADTPPRRAERREKRMTDSDRSGD
ncbi:MAG: hypothetical protein M9895_12610 [Aquamicrobium sp.]|uniref:hypothetical protein n=1 Tax=Aquamicrobium sp. TaxID=1872579 RepID=UPI00349E4E08|nr:hypothetical protein [Aquamicrobium sp.]